MTDGLEPVASTLASARTRAALCNNNFWVDRTTGVGASLYSNVLPFVTSEAPPYINDEAAPRRLE